LDKYLYLVRRFLYVSLRSLAKTDWKDTELIDELMSTLADTPLNARDAKVPNGLRYHMLDIYPDELEKVDEEYEAEMPAEKLLAPLMTLQKDCPTRTVREQTKEVLNDERVRKWLGLEEAEGGADKEAQEENGDGGAWYGIED
jgi:ribosomal RNA-processing protein 1